VGGAKVQEEDGGCEERGGERENGIGEGE
jgi:hypothetical protein